MRFTLRKSASMTLVNNQPRIKPATRENTMP